MPRDPVVGDRALTGAERMAHQRQKQKAALRHAEAALGKAFRWIDTNAGTRDHPTDLLNELADAMGALHRMRRA